MASPSYTNQGPQSPNQTAPGRDRFGRRISGATKYVKNFSRRFNEGFNGTSNPAAPALAQAQGSGSTPASGPSIDISALPQTAGVPPQQGVNGGLAGTQGNAAAYEQERQPISSPPQAQPGAQQQPLSMDTSHGNTNGVVHHGLTSPPDTPESQPSLAGRPSTSSQTPSDMSSPTPILRPPQPTRIHSRIFAATRDFKLPELPWLCGTWYITHTTLPMWRDKRNVRVTYTRVGEGDKLDDMVTFQIDPAAEAGTVTGSAVSPSSASGTTTTGSSVSSPSGVATSPSPPSSGATSPDSAGRRRRSWNLKSNLKTATKSRDMTALKSSGNQITSDLKDQATDLRQEMRQQTAPAQRAIEEMSTMSAGAGDGTDRLKGMPGELKQVRGTDTVMSDGSYLWKGKGFGMLRTGTWEVLGWGGGGKGAAVEREDVVDERNEQWVITYFGRTMTSPPGISVYSRKKKGLSGRKLEKLERALRQVDGDLVKESRGGRGGGGKGDFGRLVDGLFEVPRDP